MLHLETIAPPTLALLKKIQSLHALADTRLVGGTALALQLGHRISVDLDFFGRWDEHADLLGELSSVGKAEKESGTPDGKMAFFYVDDIKVDCVSYDMYGWLEEPVCEDGVRLAGIKDIAAMKINAITNRGTRKDFIDFAILLEHNSIETMFAWYRAKYPAANPALALRSLSYFTDAETMPMPKMLIPFDWQTAKARISDSVRQFISHN